jgi:hypothetical protein
MEAPKVTEKAIPTVEEIRKVAPFCRGKPENFYPKRVGKKTPPPRRLGPKSPLPTPPSRINTPQHNEPMISEAIFGVDITVFEIQPRQTFEANYSKVPDLAVKCIITSQSMKNTWTAKWQKRNYPIMPPVCFG